MKRIVLLGIAASMFLPTIAFAEVPTASDLRAYQTFKIPPEYTGNDILEKMNVVWAKKQDDQCFLEHVCAAEGTIGLSLECEKDLSVCLHILKTKGVSFDLNSAYAQICAPLFKAVTPRQNAMIASPKGCEVPPPPSAVQATMTPGEAQCLADKYCTESHLPAGYEPLCRKNYDACTRSLSEMEVSDRALCRGKRELGLAGQKPQLSSNGPCRPEMPDPVLARVPETKSSAEPKRKNSPKSKAQGSPASVPKKDEFDFGDLDF